MSDTVTVSKSLLASLTAAKGEVYTHLKNLSDSMIRMENHFQHLEQLASHATTAPATQTQQPAPETAAPASVGAMPWDQEPQPQQQAASTPAETQDAAAAAAVADNVTDMTALREGLKQRMSELSRTYGDVAMTAIKNIIQARSGQPSFRAVTDDKLATIGADLTGWEQWYKQQGAA